jgi:8-oxo-dGTP diphosphatase
MPKHREQKRYIYHHPRPMVTVDMVVLTVIEARLRVLLIRRRHWPFEGRWALPGGFVEMNESLDDAARRELAEETGLFVPPAALRAGRRGSGIWMDQLHSFGEPDRDPRGRTITVAYLILLRPDRVPTIHAGDDAKEADWFDVYRLPRPAFDHRQIIRRALARLRQDLEHTDVSLRLAPPAYALTDLQEVWELILHRRLERRAFRKMVRGIWQTVRRADTCSCGS